MDYLKYSIDAAYIILAVVTVVIFTKRGFVASVFRYGRTVTSAVLAYFFGPRVSEIVYERMVYQGVLEWVTARVNAVLTATAEAINIDGVIDSLPFLVKQFIDADALKEKYGMASGGFENVAAEFSESVAQPLSSMLSNLIAYAAVFFASMLVLFVVFKILNAIFKLPGLNAINRALGMVLGIFAACFLLAAITYILGVLVGIFGSMSTLNQLVETSYLFRLFNNEISIYELF